MSQLQVNRINDASGGVLAPISSVMRNRIINGAMVIDQRNAGASVSISNNTLYSVDRFPVTNVSDGIISAQRSTTAPTGFINSLQVTVTTADASIGATQYSFIRHVIEGFNTADLGWGTASAKNVTLSFWVRSSVTGTFGGALQNSAENRAYAFTYTINSANTWEQKSVTIAGDTTGTWLTNNGAGIIINLSLGTGTTYSSTAGSWVAQTSFNATGSTALLNTLNATFNITGVQLEVGTQATSFEYRQYQQELALCQRYCYVLRGNTTSNSTIGSGYWNSATASVVVFQPKTSMRATPTLIFSSTSDISALQVGINWNAVSAIALASEANADFAQIQATSTGGTSADASNIRISNSTSAYIGLTAEL